MPDLIQVQVSVVGRHTREGADAEEVVTRAEGILEKLTMEEGSGKWEAGCRISYMEPPEEGGAGVVLELTKDALSMTRTGDRMTHMVFCKERPYRTTYTTPYGKMEMEVVTSHLFAKKVGEDIYIKTNYALKVGDSVMSSVSLEIAARSV